MTYALVTYTVTKSGTNAAFVNTAPPKRTSHQQLKILSRKNERRQLAVSGQPRGPGGLFASKSNSPSDSAKTVGTAGGESARTYVSRSLSRAAAANAPPPLEPDSAPIVYYTEALVTDDLPSKKKRKRRLNEPSHLQCFTGSFICLLLVFIIFLSPKFLLNVYLSFKYRCILYINTCIHIYAHACIHR